MKIDEIKNVLDILSKFTDKSEAVNIYNDKDIRIVILQRGWVVVGRFFQNGHDCCIENGYVIRNWGTTKGLGELAMSGKQESTRLDAIPLTKFHELTIVASMICDIEKWKDLCK